MKDDFRGGRAPVQQTAYAIDMVDVEVGGGDKHDFFHAPAQAPRDQGLDLVRRSAAARIDDKDTVPLLDDIGVREAAIRNTVNHKQPFRSRAFAEEKFVSGAWPDWFCLKLFGPDLQDHFWTEADQIGSSR
jgi:hypothetical protein